MTRLLFLLTLPFALLPAQEDFQQAATETYGATLRALRNITTKADVQKMVDAIDAPEWQSHLPDGQTLSRDQAIDALSALLEVPQDQRPAFDISFLHFTQRGDTGVAVYWAYRQAGRRLVGSLAKDTWRKSAAGWRRTGHEKLIPDQTLVDDGKGVILPSLR